MIKLKTMQTGYIFLMSALTFILLLSFNIISHPHSDPDTYWHIKAGLWIIENQTVPNTDPFTWYGIEQSLPWIYHGWGFGLLLGIVYMLGSWYGVYGLVALIAGLTVLAMGYLLTIRKTNFYIIVSLLCVVMPGLFIFQTPRPQLISFLFILIFMILLEKNMKIKAIIIAWLGILMHGGIWPMYFAIGCYYTVKKILVRTNSIKTNETLEETQQPQQNKAAETCINGVGDFLPQKTTRLGNICGFIKSSIKDEVAYLRSYKINQNTTILDYCFVPLILIATIAGPYGIDMLYYPFPTITSPSVINIAEWQRIDPFSPIGMLWVIVLLIIVFIILDNKTDIIDKLFLFAIVFLSGEAARHVPFTYIVAAPLAASFLLKNPTTVNNYFIEPSMLMITKIRKTFLVISVVLVSVFLFLVIAIQIYVNTPSLGNDHYLKWMKETRPHLGKMLNEYGRGGWLVYHDLLPMHDGRADVFGGLGTNSNVTLFEDYTGINKDNINDFIDKYNIDSATFSTNSRIYRATRDMPNMVVLYSKDDLFVVAFNIKQEE